MTGHTAMKFLLHPILRLRGMQKSTDYDYENGTGSQMNSLELGINGHFSICPSLYPQHTDVKDCRSCYLIDTVYRMGYNNGWQEAHETWEA